MQKKKRRSSAVRTGNSRLSEAYWQFEAITFVFNHNSASNFDSSQSFAKLSAIAVNCSHLSTKISLLACFSCHDFVTSISVSLNEDLRLLGVFELCEEPKQRGAVKTALTMIYEHKKSIVRRKLLQAMKKKEIRDAILS